MENINYVIYLLYVGMAVPVALMLLVLDNKYRMIMLYFLLGLTAVISVGRLNRIIGEALFGDDSFMRATTIGPMIEEIAKGIPVVLLCTFGKKLPKKQLLSCAYASGLGFAVLENVVFICNNYKTVNLLFALFRGIGAGLMHSLCTSIVALGIIFSWKYKKLYWCILFAFASFAMVYHATFNSLVCSVTPELNNIGIFMPISTLIPVAIYLAIKRIKNKKTLDKSEKPC